MVFSLRSRLTEEEKSVLYVLKILFGNDIVDYMIIVFTNEDSLDHNNETMKDYLEECHNFKEILAACNNRMVLFDNSPKASESKKAKQVQELLDLVEIVRMNNKKPFMVDLSHETMEETKLIKTASSLERKLTEEKNARLETEKRTKKLHEESIKEKNARFEAEKRANKLQEEFIEEFRKLSEKLDKVEKELKKKGDSCIIL